MKTPSYLGQSTLNFDCITNATAANYDPLLEFKTCYQDKHVLKFKLVEGFVQEMIINNDGSDDEIKPQQRMNNSELEISDFKTIRSERFVRMPPEPGVVPDTNFDTLWSMVITLEPTV